MKPVIGVGIIGVTPGDDWKSAGWANIAHIPALQALPEYEIRAVASRSCASARQVARQYSVPHLFDNAESLCACPDVDLVVITVRVPAHLALVRQALDAGKHILCEWPLGNGLAEAEEMAAAARGGGTLHAVGLQARAAPVIRYVRDLIADGYIGDVLSTNMLGSGMNWGPGMPARNIYTLDKCNGATLLSIAAGHALDALCYCLGEFESLVAVSALRRPQLLFLESRQIVDVSAEDQWAVTGRLTNGAVASVHYRGGAVRGNNFSWEINGTEGDLRLSCDFGAIQFARLTLRAGEGADTLRPLRVPDSYYLTPDLPDPALNVAHLYALFAKDLSDGGCHCPDFDDALIRHRMLDAIECAARTGTRQSYI